MKSRLFHFLWVALVCTGLTWAQTTPTPDKQIYIQFPNNPVSDIATFYEVLTKKRLIRDANLAGPNLTLVVTEPVSKDRAIGMIEALLFLNGYSLVPVDPNTSKLLGPSKTAKSESVPLYVNASALPEGEEVVSFFMPFSFISSEEAKTVFESYVTIRPFGSIALVPSSNALVITENAPLVRRLIALKQLVDVQGGRTLTEFFTLERADSEKVAETINEVFQGESGVPKPAGSPGAAPVPPTGGKNAAVVRAIPDKRTNRVLVVALETQMPLIKKLVEDMDIAVAFEEPYERALRFVSAGDVLPVLANLLQEGKDADAATVSQASNELGSSQQSVSSAGSQFSGVTGSSGGTKPDKLTAPTENTIPLSIMVGSSRIIADRSLNKIMVIGPPESRSKAARVLDLLDRKPKQIYLATIIGQLTLGKGVDAGIDFVAQFGDIRVQGQGSAANIANLVSARQGVDLVPDPSQIVDQTVGNVAQTATQAVNQFLPLVSGLTVFGTIADSVDVYARALASNNKFEVISRPVLYTANNKKAVISSGLQVPVPSTTLTSPISTIGVNGSVANASTLEYKDVVLKLEVIPLINSENEVTLQIAQQNDNIQEQVQISDNTVPVIGTQELTTTVTVPNRHTVVLGGLITDQEQRTQTGVPFLKDIPGLGYIFSSTKKDVVRRELIVMIQPFIIDDEQKLDEANYIEKANTSFQSGMYEDKVPVRKALLPDTPKAKEQKEKAKKEQ